jgi:protein-disulfide isomerase
MQRSLLPRIPWALAAACSIMLGVCGLAARLAAEDVGTVMKSAESMILQDPGTPRAGAMNPDVILVEYFDYNCSYCKQLNPVLAALLKSDAKVALVYKEWPILSETSKYAAESALAAGWQGKYPAAHEALMRAPHLSSHMQVESLLQAAGIDLPALQRDRAAHGAEIRALLQRDDSEAGALGIRGTPGLLVGRHVINGVFELEGLQQAVAVARLDH